MVKFRGILWTIWAKAFCIAPLVAVSEGLERATWLMGSCFNKGSIACLAKKADPRCGGLSAGNVKTSKDKCIFWKASMYVQDVP